MAGDDLVAFLYCDLGAIVRGRSLAATDVERKLGSGLGWVPANQSLTPFGAIAEPNPFGSVGDLRIKPDPATRVRVDFSDDGASPLEFFLCDAVCTDGSPWEACPRVFLRGALDDLYRETGARLVGCFEHEFQMLDDGPPAPPFSLEAQRAVEPFGPRVIAALREAGADPETFLPEFGAHQYEIPCGPAEGLAAADRSVIMKEVVREVARRCGRRVTFAPLIAPEATGNGAHVHFSLIDDAGVPLLYDAGRPGRLGELGGRMAAGVLRHARAIAAFATPSGISFQRLTPHRWSAGAVCLGERNRETILRISPVVEMPGNDPAPQHNLEFRAADSTANPYLALGAIVRAALEGIRQQLPTPEILTRDPATLGPEEQQRFGVDALPKSLEEALDALEADEVARGWLPPLLHETYAGMKRAELAAVTELETEDVYRHYARVY